MASLLSRLLEWPGYHRSDLDFNLDDGFSAADLVKLIEDRIKRLEDVYGKASCTAILPVRAPKTFLQRRKCIDGAAESLKSIRVGVAQTALPRLTDFTRVGPELNDPTFRRNHRRHLSAVLGGVHRMLQVRETHRGDGSGVELLVLPELSVHLSDVRSHLVPFVKQHHCMVFAGIVYHRPAGDEVPLANTGYWIIPVQRPGGGWQIEVLEQGKWNLTPEETALGISPFRPVQWLLELVNPSNLEPVWSMSGSICYDSTDLALATDLRDLTQMFVVPALNQDVGTFDNMVAALHYHMFQHVIVVNSGEFGGSTGQAPFSDRHKRTIFHTHGNEQVSISFFEVDCGVYTDGTASLKTPPAGRKMTRRRSKTNL